MKIVILFPGACQSKLINYKDYGFYIDDSGES